MGDPTDIEYVLCWQPKAGLLASFPNLKLILSLAAGFDHVLQDPARPAHVPIVRIIDDTLSTMMSEYAVYAVLGFHRFMPQFQSNQSNKIWKKRWPNFTPDTHIGVLGIGAIGSDVAYKLRGLGFQVHGWSRNSKQLEGISCHAGKDGLFEILPQCQQIVVVLPLTSETCGIVNKETLAALPEGAFITNIGRGGHVIDEDLLAALDSGHIAGAFLDVFNQEPLPVDHSYWNHPKVITMSRVRSCRAPAPSLSPPTSNAIAAANRLTVLPTSNEGTEPCRTTTSTSTLSIELCAWMWGAAALRGFSNRHAPLSTGHYHWQQQIILPI